jgi:hypothetical protein
MNDNNVDKPMQLNKATYCRLDKESMYVVAPTVGGTAKSK